MVIQKSSFYIVQVGSVLETVFNQSCFCSIWNATCQIDFSIINISFVIGQNVVQNFFLMHLNLLWEASKIVQQK